MVVGLAGGNEPFVLRRETRVISARCGSMPSWLRNGISVWQPSGTTSISLGFTTLGHVAGEVMVVHTAMLAGLPYTAFRDAILTHPTMAEGLLAFFASPRAEFG